MRLQDDLWRPFEVLRLTVPGSGERPHAVLVNWPGGAIVQGRANIETLGPIACGHGIAEHPNPYVTGIDLEWSAEDYEGVMPSDGTPFGIELGQPYPLVNGEPERWGWVRYHRCFLANPKFGDFAATVLVNPDQAESWRSWVS